MPILAPTQALLVLLAAWAIALLLHWLRPRRRRVVVPFMPLWETLLLPEATTRLFGRLRRIGSLLIALAISGLLVWALADPSAALLPRAPRSTVVLIDAGQHMQATDVEPSRLAHARRLALQLVAAKAPSEQLLIAQLDASVTPLSTLTSDRTALGAAVERVTATDATSDFGAGVALALQLLDGRADAKVVLISDAAFGAADAALDRLRKAGVAFEHMPLGRAARNLGIRSFSARRYVWNRSQSELLLDLENAGDQVEPIELTLSGDASPIAVTQLELPAHSVVRRVFGDIPAQTERLEAHIVARGPLGLDALAADDRAYAVLPPQTRTRVLLVSNGDRYLEAALLLDRAHVVRVIAPSEYRGSAGYDVVVFDAFAPAAPPDAASLYIGPPKAAQDFPFKVKGSVAGPHFETYQREHPLLRQLALRDVNISRAQLLEPRAGDQVIAASRGAPLIVTGQRAGQPFVALAFDVRDSDLPLRVAWPLFITHAVDFLHASSTGYQASLQVGTEQRMALAQAASSARITSAGGVEQRVSVRADGVWFRPQSAGFYRVETPSEQQLWAANRAADVSLSIKPQRLSAAGSAPARSGLSFRPDAAWQLLVALAWLFVTLEWFAFQRRWTV